VLTQFKGGRQMLILTKQLICHGFVLHKTSPPFKGCLLNYSDV